MRAILATGLSRRAVAIAVTGGLTLLLATIGLAVIWVGPRLGIRSQLWSAAFDTVAVADRSLDVLLVRADSGGFRRVTSIGELDGMLFGVLDKAPTLGMDGVPMALDVAFFDGDGRLIEVLSMPVCEQSPCPVFAPAQAFQYALEAPAGTLEWISPGARLSP
jgi:uncharacterized membrane protein (UPF0127 family)